MIRLNLISVSQSKLTDKDIIIEELRRKLIATENQRDVYKENWEWSAERELKYFTKLQDLGVEPNDN
jgi:hypothetical protein